MEDILSKTRILPPLWVGVVLQAREVRLLGRLGLEQIALEFDHDREIVGRWSESAGGDGMRIQERVQGDLGQLYICVWGTAGLY